MRAGRGRRARHQGGQGLVEYGLVLTLIAAVAIASLLLLGGSINGVLSDIGNGFGAHEPGATAAPTVPDVTPTPTKTVKPKKTPKPPKTPKPTKPPKTPKPTKPPKTPKAP